MSSSLTSDAAEANSPAPSVAEGPNDADESPQPTPVAATQDATSSAAAVDLAQRAMTAFARPTVGVDTWFNDLAPLLTPEARSAYYGTDPAEVPAHAVTGPARAETSPSAYSSAYLAHVTVPTDAGDYRVLLSREGGDAGWLVETLTPPDGVH